MELRSACAAVDPGDGGLVEDAEAQVGGHLRDGSRWAPPLS